MKSNILIIALMTFSTFAFSQETKTLFSNNNSKTRTLGGYGGPLIQLANINNDWGIIIGGKGGVIVNRRFAFGGIGKGLVSSSDFSRDDLNGNNNAPLTLKYRVGGLFLEYLFQSESPFRFTIPLNVMAGRISVNNATSDAEVESSGVFILEPGINLDLHVSKNFTTAINLSYRQVLGVP